MRCIVPIYMPSLPNYERYNPWQHLVDPGGPHENVGLSHLDASVVSQLASHALPSSIPTPGSSVTINPQPLPPKEMLQPWLNPGLLVSLNPQPLPPEPPPESLWNTSAVLFGGGSEVGILPPFYHGPTPDPAPWTAVGAWLR